MMPEVTGDTIARALRRRRVGDGKWDGQCPCCSYKKGFAIRHRRDGLPLIYCHAGGCSQSDLIGALRRLGVWPAGGENQPKPVASARPRVLPPLGAGDDLSIAVGSGAQPAEVADD